MCRIGHAKGFDKAMPVFVEHGLYVPFEAVVQDKFPVGGFGIVAPKQSDCLGQIEESPETFGNAGRAIKYVRVVIFKGWAQPEQHAKSADTG
jgi:hypothetical protein